MNDKTYSMILTSEVSRGMCNRLREWTTRQRELTAKNVAMKFFGGPSKQRAAFLTESPYGNNVLERLRKTQSPIQIEWLGSAPWKKAHEVCAAWSKGGQVPEETDEVKPIEF